MTRHLVRIAFAMVLALASGCALASGPSHSVATDMAYIEPARLVDIGGRRMNIYCVGHGSPTVKLCGSGPG